MGATTIIVFLLLTNTFFVFEACDMEYYKIGCYNDLANDRTFHNILLNARYPGAKNNPGYSISWDIKKYQEFLPRFICDCAKAVASVGTKYFGIQYFAECWSGVAEPQDFVELGLSKSCVNSSFGPCQAETRHCSGSAFENLIYYIPDQAKTEATTSKVTTKPPLTTTKTELPPTTTKPPPTTTEHPPTTTEPPSTTTEPPSTTTELPSTTTEPPSTTTELPSTTTELPPTTTTTKPPLTTTKWPPPTTTELSPTTTTKPPTTTTRPPPTTTELPPTTTELPSTTTKPQTTTTEALTTEPVAVTKTEEIVKPGCMTNADILIALDVSSSISKSEFEKRKQLLADFVAKYPVNKNSVHFALMHYNHFIHTDFTFENPHFFNVREIEKTITQVPLLGGATLTQKALEEALRVFSSPQYGARPTSKKILIIVTDGYTYGGEETLELPSLKLQLAGVNIVPVGFGQRTNLVGLRMMSSNVLTLDNILEKTGDELLQYLDMLVHVVCEEPSKRM